VGHIFLRAQGRDAGMMGWPDSPRIEELRLQWIAAPDLPAQQKIAQELQRQAMIDVPYVPLGQVLTVTAFRTSISGVLNGFVTFWKVQKA
jgi:peptide/nickel transport system substrate-binding protein